MFTGIVEELGVLASARPRPDSDGGGVTLVFDAARVLEGTAVGDSICVNGCCLTVTDTGAGWWSADAVPETLSRTNLGSLRPGSPVNLERSLTLSARLGGHLVQGHVDAVGHITAAPPDLAVAAPEAVLRYLVEKGSVTVDGISLTVVKVTGEGFTVAVIPHTLGVTTLGRKEVGDPVNLEVDVMAKYAERLLAGGAPSPYRNIGQVTAGPTGA
jgi:riboflavin synthase